MLVSFVFDCTLFLLRWGGKPQEKAHYTSPFMKESAFTESIGVQAEQRVCSTLAWRSRTLLALVFNFQPSNIRPSFLKCTARWDEMSYGGFYFRQYLTCLPWISVFWFEWLMAVLCLDTMNVMDMESSMDWRDENQKKPTNNMVTEMFASRRFKTNERTNMSGTCWYQRRLEVRTGIRAMLYMWRWEIRTLQ